MEILNGKKIASDILGRLEAEIQKENIAPGLGVALVGEDEASEIYVNLKQKSAEKIGINFRLIKLPENVSENVVLEEVEKLNQDSSVQGIIVQLPLPDGLDKNKIIETIDPEKDVDGFHPENIQAFFEGHEVFPPVFPEAIIELIKAGGEKLENKKALIVCNSDEFGKAMQKTLENNQVVSEYILHDDLEKNLEEIKKADIVITACGIANLIKGEMLKEGVIIIDGGIVKDNGEVSGDVDLASVQNMTGFVSPVPGGVGPVTIACLLQNVVLANKKSH